MNAFERLLEHPDFLEGRDWRRRRVTAQEMILRQGEFGHEIFLILAGTVRVLGEVELAPRKRVKPGFFELTRGAVFGELALFDSGPRSASVSAVGDGELAVLDGARLLAFFDRHPETGYAVCRNLLTELVSRLRRTNRKLCSLFAWGLKAHGIEPHVGGDE
jgi:CRP-like cAMP-binding protein